MNTPAHIILGAAVFARPGQTAFTFAAVAGGLVPDLPLMLMVAWSIWIAGIPPEVVFGQMYFSDGWQQVFAIDHNLWLWSGGFLFGLWAARPALTALAGSGLMHAVADFFLHNDDARSQLWPLTWWKFRSPVSYYDPAHYGNLVAPLEIALALVLCAVLWRRFRNLKARALIALIGLAELAPGLAFALMLH